MPYPLRTLALLGAVALCAFAARLAAAAEDRDKPAAMPPSAGPGFVADRNPIMPGADPHAMVIGDRIWLYPTGGGGRFYAFSSPDLRRWERHGPVLDFAEIPWIREGGYTETHPWAPAVAGKDGKYYFYYSVGPQSHGLPARIGVAVGDSSAGPFKDSGKALLTGGNGFEAIDPMVFSDPKSGKAYFYAGGSAGSTLRVFEMNPDMVSFAREVKVETPPRFTEGVFMHLRDGVYHLTYSHGSYRDASYSVHHATSDSPTGPWRYRGVILRSDARHKGPGHHSVIRHPKRDEWYIVYHRWNDREDDGPYRGSRQIAVDVLEHGPDGAILPVKMTDTPPVLALSGRAGRFDNVPGVVVSHLPASSGRYVGSPALAVLPNGDYVATHDEFGPKSGEEKAGVTRVFRSTDRGATWKRIATVRGAFWSGLFVHRGALYLMGTDRQYGRVVIRRSGDGGATWT